MEKNNRPLWRNSQIKNEVESKHLSDRIFNNTCSPLVLPPHLRSPTLTPSAPTSSNWKWSRQVLVGFWIRAFSRCTATYLLLMANHLRSEDALEISSRETTRQGQRDREKKFQLSTRNRRWSSSANSGSITPSIRPLVNLVATSRVPTTEVWTGMRELECPSLAARRRRWVQHNRQGRRDARVILLYQI